MGLPDKHYIFNTAVITNMELFIEIFYQIYMLYYSYPKSQIRILRNFQLLFYNSTY